MSSSSVRTGLQELENRLARRHERRAVKMFDAQPANRLRVVDSCERVGGRYLRAVAANRLQLSSAPFLDVKHDRWRFRAVAECLRGQAPEASVGSDPSPDCGRIDD